MESGKIESWLSVARNSSSPLMQVMHSGSAENRLLPIFKYRSFRSWESDDGNEASRLSCK